MNRSLLFALLVFTFFYYINAFICDDAFISFRTVDNFVRGYGLRWNISERVQVFTNPLYTLIISCLYYFVYDRSWLPNPHRMWMISMILSFVLSSSVIILIWKFVRDTYQKWLILSVLMISQAFVSFCSSGLETPLSYLLIGSFYLMYLRDIPRKPDPGMTGVYTLLVALSLVNRLDTIILFFPAWISILYGSYKQYFINSLLTSTIAMIPMLLWLGCSIIYFGFFFPNSYYAKLGLNFDFFVILHSGLSYALFCLQNDPATLSVCITGTIVSLLLYIKIKDIRYLLAQIASMGYILYAIKIGGDFLGYRFFSLPFLISTIVMILSLFKLISPAYFRIVTISGISFCFLYNCLLPSSPLRIIFEKPTQPDVKYYYKASAIRSWRPGNAFPFTQFHSIIDVPYGYQMRTDTLRVSVSGGGMRGFVRGPKDHIIDPQSITDPLMARLPVIDTKQPFRPGHIMKPVPAGYVESIYNKQNLIVDAQLKVYYERLRLITCGNLWSRKRWDAIIKLNCTSLRRYQNSYIIQDPPYEYDKR